MESHKAAVEAAAEAAASKKTAAYTIWAQWRGHKLRKGGSVEVKPEKLTPAAVVTLDASAAKDDAPKDGEAATDITQN